MKLTEIFDPRTIDNQRPWTDWERWKIEIAAMPHLQRLEVSLCTWKTLYSTQIREEWAKGWMFGMQGRKNGIETIHFDWEDQSLEKYIWDPVSKEVVRVSYTHAHLP
ncbi:hypothetical protein V5O48_010669 [Marasmius crinis-equi]|uniref:Uncharacterized protein n=1 Tax=Marasmius crinis-equi TaxID=585013 RepID=A0ABR3F7R4_9AGAR